MGYTYGGPAAVQVVSGHLAGVVQGRDATAPAASFYGSGGFTSYDDRLEGMAFDGVLAPEPGGVLRPDRDRPGLGLEVRVADLKPCRVV